MTTKITWNEETTAVLAQSVSGTVTQEQLGVLAEQLGGTKRQVGSKIRSMVKAGVLDVEVELASSVAVSKWNAEQEEGLKTFVAENHGVYTYAEIAASFNAGEFSSKQVQGKILSMDLTDAVKPSEKKEAPKTYTADEEATYISLAEQGEFLEVIADALGKTVPSVRGKGLSLYKEGRIAAIPAQRDKVSKEKKDTLEGLDIPALTVEEIAEATGKTVRGIKSILSRRGIECLDYNGTKKREKLDAKVDA